MKKVGVIGSGISGLSTAFYLSKSFNVTIFEKKSRFGGHANTYNFNHNNKNINVDSGFIVYNNKNYPNFVKILNFLGIQNESSDMSFAMSVDKNFEYSGSMIGMLANYKNFKDKQYFKMFLDITRFYKKSGSYVQKVDDDCTLEDFLKKFNFSEYFKNYHIVPMASAIWSSPENKILKFPIKSLLDFYNNHNLLNFIDRPQWRTVSNGAINYVEGIVNYLKKNRNNVFFLNSEIINIRKYKNKLTLTNIKGKKFDFDYVVFANHTNEASSILKKESGYLAHSLKNFKYQKNLAYLHLDHTLMPKNKLLWSSWNYSTNSEKNISCITYWMNKLQRLNTKNNIFVTLNPINIPEENKIIKVFKYEHPVFDQKAFKVQKIISDNQGIKNIYFSGSWNGYGFHEDGVVSGLKVAKLLNAKLDWIT